MNEGDMNEGEGIENAKTRKGENAKGTRPRPGILNKDTQDRQDERLGQGV
jgi:hypothetical protein